MKADRQHKEATSRLIQPSKGGGGYIVDNRKKMNDNIWNTTGTPSPINVIQLAKADLFIQGTNTVSARVGKDDHATGGVDHAEQKSWDQALPEIRKEFHKESKDTVVILFEIDMSVCEACQDWFEKTAFESLQILSTTNGGKKFQLIVKVGDVQTEILGVDNTRWPKGVGDVVRVPGIESLRNMLTKWGGLSGDSFFYYGEDGCEIRVKVEEWEDMDVKILEVQSEIQKSNNIYNSFLETGMLLLGDRKEIDFESIEKEKSELGLAGLKHSVSIL